MKGIIILFIFLNFHLLSFTQNEPYQNIIDLKYKPEQLNEDFKIFRGALEQGHPSLYLYISKVNLDKLFDNAFSKLNRELTELEFFNLLAPIVDSIKCGHTSIGTSVNYNNYIKRINHYFPLELKFTENNYAYILKNFSSNQNIPIGAELLSINNQSVNDIVKKLFKYLPSDAGIPTFKYRQLDVIFQRYYAIYISLPDTFFIEFKDPKDNRISHTKIAAIKWNNEILNSSISSFNEKKKLLKFKIIENSKTAILTINTFKKSFFKKNKLDFNKFIKSAFKELNNKHIENLIVDLRWNNGGDLILGSSIYSYLTNAETKYCKSLETSVYFKQKKFSYRKYSNLPRFYGFMVKKGLSRYLRLLKTVKPAEDSFNKNIYFIINGASFSSTTMLLSVIKSNKKGIIIGEETGGSYYGNGMGKGILFTLPNTKLMFQFFPYQIMMSANPIYPLKSGIIPDYKVLPNIKNLIDGVDTEMNYVLELIKNK